MIFDTHAHLNFSAFKKDRKEVIKRSLENDIFVINVGTKFTTSEKAVEIAEEYPEEVYSSVGLHPIHLETGLVKIDNDEEETEFLTKEEYFDYEKYKTLAKSKKVVAIGEIGLDYYYKPKSKTKREEFKEKQKEVFLKQLELAEELNLPVIIHCRMAHSDLWDILKDRNIKGVIHCFSGSWEEAEKYLSKGFFLGFNGIIFKLDLDEVIKKTPIDQILLETDCPYLTPPKFKGQRNEPIFIKETAKRITELKEISYGEVCEKTFSNAKKLFNLKNESKA